MLTPAESRRSPFALRKKLTPAEAYVSQRGVCAARVGTRSATRLRSREAHPRRARTIVSAGASRPRCETYDSAGHGSDLRRSEPSALRDIRLRGPWHA